MKLIFVYNADGGMKNAIVDLIHKNLSPDTYECSLCMITYGNTGMKSEWREFVDSLEHDVEFLHRDEFLDRYPHQKNDRLPAAYSSTEDEELRQIISSDKFNSVADLRGLIEAVQVKI